MKKIILFFIFLLSTASFSINISITNLSGNPLKEVIVNINKQVKISDSNGKVSFNIKDEILNISLSKEGFYEETLTLKNNPQNITLIMKPLKKSLVTFEFPISEGIIKYREVGAKKYVQLPFLTSKKLITFPYGTYEVVFESKTRKQVTKILNFNSPSEYFFINLEPKKNQFFITTNISKHKNIKFYKNSIEKIKPHKKLTLIILKNSNIVKTIKLDNTFTPTELENGIYDFVIENNITENLIFRGIKIDDNTNKIIVISVPPVHATVKGFIKNNNQFIGGVKIDFIDVNNNSYETISTFAGDFSINLPPQKYRIVLKKPGFVIQESQNLIYDFTIPNEIYNLSLDAEELLSNIQGTIVDKKNNPIPNANISIKNGDYFIELKSDLFGNFETSILPGLLFIKVEKEGYKSFGLVTKLGRFSSISGLEISLDPILANISGTISSSFSPKKNIQLTLRDEKGEVVATSLSNEHGFYEFYDIKVNQKYFISVGTQDYKHYYSKPFLLKEEGITNKNIILQERETRLYLEFLFENKPLSKKEVIINSKIYKTDTNGFILLNLSEGTKSININIKNYNFRKIINLRDINTNPNHLTIEVR